MGCFNVCCSVSNISIGSGDKVLLLPLANKGYWENGKPFEYNKLPMADSSLIYPTCYFEPVALPIKGEYDDYGSLEKIEKDVNTEAIEKYFGVSIETFVKGITEYRQYKDPVTITDSMTTFEKLLPRLTGMFIYQPIFEHLKENGDTDWIFNYQNSGYAAEYDKYVKVHNRLSSTKDTMDHIRSLIDNKEGDIDSLMAELKILTEEVSLRDIIESHDNRFLDMHREWFRFRDIFGPFIAKGLLKEDFCAFQSFYNTMYSANRFLFPAMNGEQHGNLDASLLLARETVRLLEAKKKKHMDDCGEYYEE